MIDCNFAISNFKLMHATHVVRCIIDVDCACLDFGFANSFDQVNSFYSLLDVGALHEWSSRIA